MGSTLTAPPWPSSRDESYASVPQSVKMFYRGEPLALGITQILIGIMHTGFGVFLLIMDTVARNYILMVQPVWTGILYIISGSLSVAASRNPKMPMVKGMLGMNVVSSVAAGIGIVFFCIYLPRLIILAPREAHYICRQHSDNERAECIKEYMRLVKMLYGIMAVFLVFSILEFCITISTAAFGCKTVCKDNHTETVVVVYQNVNPGDDVGLPATCRDPDSTGFASCSLPSP